MTDRLKYVSERVLEGLIEDIPDNLERYVTGDFVDLSKEYGWAVETSGVDIDLDRFGELRPGATSPDLEVHNSLVVHQALPGLRRAVAREERIWVRLCHIEGLAYARSRWLDGTPPENLEKDVRKHFFAGSLTQARDDNALSRLWWNAEIAKIAYPDDQKRGLEIMLRTADIRLNLIERSGLAGRPPIIRGIVRALDQNEWLTAKERNFRVFMRTLNLAGGGVLYEALPEKAVDDLLVSVMERAEAVLGSGTQMASA